MSLRSRSRLNLICLAAITAVTLVAVCLRFWGLSLESLDGDEAFTYRVASANISDAISVIRDDLVHPPLYYFAVHAWLHLTGHTAALALRGVSLASGVVAVALIAAIGFLFSEARTTAFIAACFLAANNLHIFYSQQARSYAFYTLLFACLLLWSWLVGRFAGRFAFWFVGAVLMSMLVYTHYVGSIYVVCIIVAITLSPISKRAKLQVWIVGFLAACSFIPWILVELGPASRHHGVADNLSWESLPTIYDLKAIWATYLGIPALHGATTAVLLVGCALIAFGVLYHCREQSPFRRLFLTTLVLTAFVPPCLLFLLSGKPFSLPIFGARHVLPSIVSYLLLAADGLVQLSDRLRARTTALMLGSCALLALELVPTAASIATEPRRMPFQTIVADTSGAFPLYTTWPYGIGETMNFYEQGPYRVRDIQPELSRLPGNFLIIFRPAIPPEENEFENLLRAGWKDQGNRDFYNGSHAGDCVRVAGLKRGLHSSVSPIANIARASGARTR